LPPSPPVVIRDSKALSLKQRELAAAWITQHALAWAVGEASVAEITALNILRASHLAMRRAVDALAVTPELLLVDGREGRIHLKVPAVSLINGDQICFSIAAASIIAKVHRDALMRALDLRHPGYGLDAHKGYGSAAHLAALRELGASPCHRPTYAPVRAAALTER
ncbi:MAG: ribonuclease HII, partial [Candidatus Andersenbacteria bacterium]|nr:ribonuclease HII [Candidatus Andersenbacteria bacterium]